ncbi:MAG: DnaK suppressor protein [Gammaproteobacteria bacterium]|jgi:DnaK suppressor protein
MVARKKTTNKSKSTVKKKAASKKAAKKKVVSKSIVKKAASKKPAKKTTKKKTKKKVIKKKLAKKKTKNISAVKKKATKKKVAKKIPTKKKAKKIPAVKKKATKKKVAKKVTKKKSNLKKTVAKKTPSKKIIDKKIFLTKKAALAEKKLSAKAIGKSNLLSLKNKSFRRNTTDIQVFTPYSANRGEEFMNTEQADHFRKILLEWKRLLMEEVDRTVHHMQDEAANFPDPNDRATQEEEFALELRTRDRERKLIRKIDEAMLRIKTDDFGYCEVCGVDIGIKRLEARPTATLCIDCKTLDEIKEKQLG